MPQRPSTLLLIFGASTRAAAYSAVRGGFAPKCGDLFADADLRRYAEIIAVPDYPQGLSSGAEHFPPSPWMYTGGLENHPRQIAAVSSRHRLMGNGPNALRVLRSPVAVAEALSRADLPFLEVRPSDSPPPHDERWLIKPLRGSAGRGIAIWDASAERSSPPAETHYFQRRETGMPISALYLALPSSTRLVGISHQLIGRRELRAGPFVYCGSIAPLALPEMVVERIRRIGEVLQGASDARGLFGADFILSDDVPWLTEVNPRYTASAELFEFLRQTSLVSWHVEACHRFEHEKQTTDEVLHANGTLANDMKTSAEISAGKVILYAKENLVAPDLVHLIPASLSSDKLPDFADLPIAGSRIGAGEPICTLMGSGPNPEVCLGELIARAMKLERELFSASASRLFS